MQKGSKIYYKHINAFTAWLQRVVLGTKFSHVSFYWGKDEYGNHLEFEANMEVEISSYKYDPKHQDIYEWVGVPDDVIATAMKEIKNRFEFIGYGVGSWLTIFIKRIFILLGFKKAIGWKLFGDRLVVCSTVIWHLNHLIASEMATRYSTVREYWQRYLYDLERYNPATFTPPDDFKLCQKHNKLFKIKES